jgi:hypothetical protein
MNGFALLTQFIFQPSRTCAQYDLAALDRMRLHRSIRTSVASRELAKISSGSPTENVFYTDGSMIDDVMMDSRCTTKIMRQGINWQTI